MMRIGFQQLDGLGVLTEKLRVSLEKFDDPALILRGSYDQP